MLGAILSSISYARGAVADVSGSYTTGIAFADDGTYSSGAGPEGNWITPAVFGPFYEIKAVLTSGSLGAGSSADDTWIASSAAPGWLVDPFPATCTLDIYFRDAASGVESLPHPVTLTGDV
jgi:hypothetical protein